MILLRNYFVGTTDGIDVKSVIHEINRTLREANAKEGLVTVVVPHPGGALAILEPLPTVVEQFKEAIRLFPGEGMETKTKSKEDVAVAPRVAAAVLGRSLSIPFGDGKLVLGPREEPMLVDLERGGRRREFCVQVMSDSGQGATAGGAKGAPRRR